MATSFETTTCSRCGGTGQYSYCRAYGTKCFKCHGGGLSFTKRGELAHTYYMKSLETPLNEIKVGDLVQVWDMTRNYFATVIQMAASDAYAKQGMPALCMTTNHEKNGKSGLTASPDDMVRVGHSREEKLVKIAIALEYQASLTKQGKPRKRKIK
jgi:hypothetical protein